MASTAPFRPEIQQLRGHAGQIAPAAALTALLEGSDIATRISKATSGAGSLLPALSAAGGRRRA
jgi:Histidine ammonia-lyase